jgi:hypothetical protein
MRVDARAWSKVNAWRHASGELCVRPGLRRIYTPESGRKLVGGFSVINSYAYEFRAIQSDGSNWHVVGQ